jgi:hypothetical protein
VTPDAAIGVFAFRRTHRLGQAEVEHLHRAIGSNLDVGRLQVAMDDPLLVRRLECFRNLPRDWQRLVNGNRPVRDSFGERRSFDQLHDQRADTVRLFQAIDLRDVRVIELRQRPGLALEARQALGVVGKGVGQNLDSDFASEVPVGGAVHLAHPAFANQGGDFVGPEAGASGQSHSKRLRL